MADITERLRELSKARWDKDAWERETTVRIPAEPDRDIDLVLANAAAEIDRLRARVADTDGAITVLGFQNAELRARVAELESNDGDCFTGMLVEIDGHVYGLRPGAARIVKEALRDAECVAMLEAKLAHECAKVTNAVRLLTEIHSLLYPAHITAEDGRVWAFRPRSIDPHEVLQELSDRIRELPEKIAAMAKDGAP